MGVDTTMNLIERLEDRVRKDKYVSLDELVDVSKMRRIARLRIPFWLVSVGMLKFPDQTERRYYGHPTEEGESIGISMRIYTDEFGEHSTIELSREAQQFIIDHLDDIIKTNAKKIRY